MEVINHSVITDSYLCGMSNKFLVRLGMHLDETLRVKNFPFIIRTGADHTIKNYLNWVEKRLSTFYFMDSSPVSIRLNNLNDRLSFVKFVKFSAPFVICDFPLFNVSKELLSKRKMWPEVRYSQKNFTLWTVRLQWLLFFTLEWYKTRYNHRVTLLLVVILKHATDYSRVFCKQLTNWGCRFGCKPRAVHAHD